MAVPAREAASLEVIEPDLVFEFLVLLLDRPALMREADQRAQRDVGGQVHQVVLGARRRAARSRSHSNQTSGASRRCRASRARASRGRRRSGPATADSYRCATRRVATRAPVGPPPTRAPRSVWRVGRQRRRVRGRPLPVSGGGATRAGVPRNTVKSDETPNAYGSWARCKERRKRGVVAELGIAQHRGDGEPAGADLPQERQGQLPLRRGIARSPGMLRPRPLRRRQPCPRADTTSRPPSTPGSPVHNATVTAIWQFATLPQRAAVLTGDTDRGRPLLGETRPVENQDARPLRYDARAAVSTVRSASHGACVMKC